MHPHYAPFCVFHALYDLIISTTFYRKEVLFHLSLSIVLSSLVMLVFVSTSCMPIIYMELIANTFHCLI